MNHLCLKAFGSIILVLLSLSTYASEVIHDYPVKVESLTIEPYTPPYETDLPLDSTPVQLRISGTIPSKYNKSIEENLDGISLPYKNLGTSYTYQILFLQDANLYTAPNFLSKSDKAQKIGTVNEQGEVQFSPEWTPKFVYREYRYTLQDKLSALLFGVKVHDQEDLSLTLERTP